MTSIAENEAVVQNPTRDELAALLKTSTGADAADMLEHLGDGEIAQTLCLLPLVNRALIFGYLPLKRQSELLGSMPFAIASELFAALPADEQVDLYNELDERNKERFLESLPKTDGEEMLALAKYPEGTAGAVATDDFLAMTVDTTVEQAFEQLRAYFRSGKETIYVLYVLDAQKRLLGTVTLHKLLLAQPDDTLETVMRREPIVLDAAAPRRQAADLIQRYDLLALPVLNGGGRMLGIITVDDAMDVAEEEDVSELVRFGGSTKDVNELDLRESSLGRMFYARFFWLAILTVFGLFVSYVVAGQEALLSEVIILAAFLAPIIDMGGNTGSQSATLVIRSMALGQIRMKWQDFWFVFRRDIVVAVCLGITIAFLECVLAYFSKGIGWDVMMVVGLSMFTVTLVGSFIGLALPFAAKKIGSDPATLSAPMITSVMDAMGVLIYFGFAYAFLGHLLEAAA